MNSTFALRLMACSIFLMVGVGLLQGQENYKWYFGNGGLGLEFLPAGGVNVLRDGFSVSGNCCATANDPVTNELMFYTDGKLLYDPSSRMVTGSTLNPSLVASAVSYSIIIASQATDLFQIFTASKSGLYYSTVRVDAAGTSVVETGLILESDIHPKIGVTRVKDEADNYWIVVKKWDDVSLTDEFVAIKSQTLTKVSSRSGKSVGDVRSSGALKGGMRISPQGDRLAISYWAGSSTTTGFFTEAHDFDNRTGIVSNALTITDFTSGVTNPNGVAFSPSGQYLYICDNHPVNNELYQYDLNSLSPSMSGRSIITYLTAVGKSEICKDIAPGPDGKLYVMNKPNQDLLTIDEPDSSYLSPSFTISNVGTVSSIDDRDGFLPYNDYKLAFYVEKKATCSPLTREYELSTNPALISQVEWDFGDPTSSSNTAINRYSISHVYSKEGSYELKLKITSITGEVFTSKETIAVINPTPEFTLGADIDIPCGNSTTLSPTFTKSAPSTASYEWKSSDGTVISTLEKMNVNVPDTYSLTVTTPDGCTFSDDITISTTPGKLSIPQNLSLCGGSSVDFDARSVANVYAGTSFIWRDNTGNDVSSSPIFSTNVEGKYSLEIDYDYCELADTTEVVRVASPNIELGNDTIICRLALPYKYEVNLDAQTGLSGINYLWGDGSTAANRLFTIDDNREISVEATYSGCVFRDTIRFEAEVPPDLRLGNDTTLCTGETITLDATANLTPSQLSRATYKWNNGSTTPQITVSARGIYSVDVTLSQCVSRDEIKVDYYPDLVLPASVTDTALCENITEYEIDLSQGYTPDQLTEIQFKWHDGDTNPKRVFTKSTLAEAAIYTDQCSVSREFNIIFVDELTLDLGEYPTELCASDIKTLDAVPRIAGAPITDLFTTLPVPLSPLYKWNTGESTPNLSVSESGTYAVEVKIGSCTLISETTLRYLPKAVFDIPTQPLCYSDTLRLRAPEGYATYEWNTGENERVIHPINSGNYKIKLTSENGCVENVELPIDLNLGPSTLNFVLGGASVEVNADGEHTPYLYSIDNKDYSTQNLFTQLPQGTYHIWMRDAKGCTFKSDQIEVKDYITPAFFSPNGDGINDLWVVEGLERFPESKGYIYDRYGRRLQTLSADNKSWDGSADGRNLLAGTYWYMIELGDGATIRGNFMLLR